MLHKHLSQFPAYGTELKPQIVEKKLRALMKGKEKQRIKWWQWEKDETTNRTEKKEKTGTV